MHISTYHTLDLTRIYIISYAILHVTSQEDVGIPPTSIQYHASLLLESNKQKLSMRITWSPSR